MRLDCEYVEWTEYGDYCSLLSDACKCSSQENVEQCKREIDLFRIGYERGLEDAHEAIKFKEYFDTLYGQAIWRCGMDINLGIRIAVFYKDKDWAGELFYKIIDQLPCENIKHTLISECGNHYIELKDGSTIIFYVASESAKGCKCDRAIIQDGVDEDIIWNRIRPTTDIPRVIAYDKNYNYKRAWG